MTAITQLWKNIARSCLTAETAPELARRLVIANNIAISTVLTASIYVLPLFILGLPALAVFLMFGILIVISTVFLNKYGFNYAGRIVLIGIIIVNSSVYGIAMGHSSGMSLFLIAAGVQPLILFEGKHRRTIVF